KRSYSLPAADSLLTLGAEIIVDHGHGTVGVKGNVRFLVAQEVVACTRADNPEVVHERSSKLSVLKRSFKADILCHARSLILIAGGFTDAYDPLGLKMGHSAHVVAVDGKRDQRVQRAS